MAGGELAVDDGPARAVARRMAEAAVLWLDGLDADQRRVAVAWAGPTEPGAPHYYRVQGPRLLLEWDNTQRGANHAHSVWRDPAAAFGPDVLARHRAAAHG